MEVPKLSYLYSIWHVRILLFRILQCDELPRHVGRSIKNFIGNIDFRLINWSRWDVRYWKFLTDPWTASPRYPSFSYTQNLQVAPWHLQKTVSRRNEAIVHQRCSMEPQHPHVQTKDRKYDEQQQQTRWKRRKIERRLDSRVNLGRKINSETKGYG